MQRDQSRSATASPSAGQYSPTVNLFRRKLSPDIVCAVPEDHPVPSFLNASTWEFAGKINQETAAPPGGYQQKAAEAGVRFRGFYLFQIHPPEQAQTGRQPVGVR